MSVLTRAAFVMQKAITLIGYAVLAIRFRPSSTVAVGPDEISGLTDRISAYTARTRKVLLSGGPFGWSSGHDFLSRGFKSRLAKLMFGPVFLAYIARTCQGAVYVGKSGYLIPTEDYRRWEFAFLRKRGLGIYCILTGGDIRSPAKAKVAVGQYLPETISDYLPLIDPYLGSLAHEQEQKQVAEVIDDFATAIINAPVDQAGYLKSRTLPFMYFAHPSLFSPLPLLQNGYINILHAPSRPILKGTQVVRASIRMLENEGYKLNYVEIGDASHGDVLRQITQSHIVINELYSLLPGMLGIEALECGRVLVTSAIPGVEECLPINGPTPWVQADSTTLVEVLRRLLAMSESELQRQALDGWNWVQRNHSGQLSGEALSKIIRTGNE